MTSLARAGLLICCLLGTAHAPAGAAPVLTAADILAREKAADKAALPGSEVEDWAVSRMGLSGTEHVIRRGEDESTTLIEGPFTTRSGKLAGQAWHQNENGYTILDIAEPSQTAHAVSQTLRLLAAPANRYVVTQVMSNGLLERTTYDATDFVPVHREFERSHHVFRLDYSIFAPDRAGGAKPGSNAARTIAATLMRPGSPATKSTSRSTTLCWRFPPTAGRSSSFPPGKTRFACRRPSTTGASTSPSTSTVTR